MTLIGLGMGARSPPSTTLPSATSTRPRPARQRSSARPAARQRYRPGVIATIFFGALAGGPAHAMTLSLLTVIAIGVLSCLAIPLLPSHAQPAGPR